MRANKKALCESIDHAADARIQSALRTTMRETTLLTVAHRLHTVVDYDRILVLSAGRCVEAGAPHERPGLLLLDCVCC